MERVEKHIADLLYIHDCVIIPGFGGFVANKHEAMVNEETGIFLPPTKEIGFNKSLIHNDGLLINHLAQKEGITYQEAEKVINNFSGKIEYTISEYGRFSFPDLGSLKKDSSGNLQFTPVENSNFLAESFGLSSFHFSPLQEVYKERALQLAPQRNLILAKNTKKIAVAAALAMGLFLFTPETRMSDMPTVNQSDFLSAFVPPTKNIRNTNNGNSEHAPVVITSNRETASLPVTVPEPSFFLVAASFIKKAPAVQHLNALRKKGFKEAELISSPTRYRVSLFSFSNKEAAYQVLEDYRQKPEFASVWLHKIK